MDIPLIPPLSLEFMKTLFFIEKRNSGHRKADFKIGISQITLSCQMSLALKMDEGRARKPKEGGPWSPDSDRTEIIH